MRDIFYGFLRDFYFFFFSVKNIYKLTVTIWNTIYLWTKYKKIEYINLSINYSYTSVRVRNDCYAFSSDFEAYGAFMLVFIDK